MVRDADHEELTPYQHLDLMQAPKDSSGQPYQIAREIPDGSHGIVLQEFVDEGLIMSAPVPDTSEELSGEPWKN